MGRLKLLTTVGDKTTAGSDDLFVTNSDAWRAHHDGVAGCRLPQKGVQPVKKLVLIRHGESTWNKENRFTGWTDVDLSDEGRKQASEAAEVLKREGYVFDVAYTSVLKRAIRTLWTVLDGMDLMWIPVHRSWRLNERHYGALQGLNKAETAAKFGEDQVKIWRRSYDIPPPVLTPDDERYPGRDPRYQGLTKEELPLTECLKDTVARFLPLWHETIAPAIKGGQKVIIAAHGLRASEIPRWSQRGGHC